MLRILALVLFGKLMARGKSVFLTRNLECRYLAGVLLQCPYCGKQGVSPLRKMFLGPSLPAACQNCQRKIGVSYKSLLMGIPYGVLYFLLKYRFGIQTWDWQMMALWLTSFLVFPYVNLKWIPLIPRDHLRRTSAAPEPQATFYTALSEDCGDGFHEHCPGSFPVNPKIHQLPADPKIKVTDRIICSCECHPKPK